MPKYHPQLEAVGSLDEATAALGMARAICRTDQARSIIIQIQGDLYHLMAEVAASPENAARFRKIDTARVEWLEEKAAAINEQVKVPEEFIIPGDTQSGAALDLARTVIRRAERRVAVLLHEDLIQNKDLLRYLNRLSSLCFLLELLENQASGKNSPTLAKDV